MRKYLLLFLIIILSSNIYSQDSVSSDTKLNAKLKLSNIGKDYSLVSLGDDFAGKELYRDTIELLTEKKSLRTLGNKEYDSTFKAKKNYILPIGEIIVLNIGVWSISRYLNPQPWARISLNSISENFKKQWVWDSDHFETNQFLHPYHGNTYFNFARSNGLSFWESTPYALGGSLMWELVMETNYPSRNDLITTTLGGIALGEMTYRLSSLVLDERKSGSERFWREVAALIIDPTRGLNRIIKGEVSRYRPKSEYELEPVKSTIMVGPSYFYESGGIYKGNGNLSMKLDMYYGNPFTDKSRKPYDFFNIKGIFSLGTQPVVSQVSVLGLLFGKNYKHKKDQNMLLGMFQHFDFFSNVYYKIGANSLGAGIIYKFPAVDDVDFESGMHVGWIVLGGGSNIKEAFKYEADGTAYRDYNYGTGFTYKFESLLTLKGKGYLSLGLYNYKIYTLDGADGEDNLLMFTPRIAVALSPNTNIGFEYNSFIRNSNYKKYNDFTTRVYEMKLFISNSF